MLMDGHKRMKNIFAKGINKIERQIIELLLAIKYSIKSLLEALESGYRFHIT